MNCEHANLTDDPDFGDWRSFQVCTSCGMALVECRECRTLWPHIGPDERFASDGFCRAGCDACCDHREGPMRPEDYPVVLQRVVNSVAEGYRWKTVLRLPYGERAAWIKREFSNGSALCGSYSFDGFSPKTKGKGLLCSVQHRTGLASWQQIQNFIEAAPKFSRVCLDCGGVTETISQPAERCDCSPSRLSRDTWCYSTRLVDDPAPSITHYTPPDSPLFAAARVESNRLAVERGDRYAVEQVQQGEKGRERYRDDKRVKKYLLAKRPADHETDRIITYRTEACLAYNCAADDFADADILAFLQGEHEWAMSHLPDDVRETLTRGEVRPAAPKPTAQLSLFG